MQKARLGATLGGDGGGPRRSRDARRVTRETDATGEEGPPEAGPTDAALIGRIAGAQDRAAFRLLFERYAGRIKGSLMRAGATAEEADEATQEAMLSIWRRAVTFDPDRAPASAWIFAIARNRRIDLIRRAKRPEPDPEDPLFRPDPPPPPGAELAAAARDVRLRAAVAGLSAPQQEAVRLAFFEGLAHPQIAERTGAPLGTVKSRLRLAAERLRAALGPGFGKELFDD